MRTMLAVLFIVAVSFGADKFKDQLTDEILVLQSQGKVTEANVEKKIDTVKKQYELTAKHVKKTSSFYIDSLGNKIVTPAQFKFNPLWYTTPSDSFEVRVRHIAKDSVIFLGVFQSNETSLLDVQVNMQPSEPPVADTTQGE